MTATPCTERLKTERLFARFDPGERTGGENWRTLLAFTIPGKAEGDFTVGDWRKVQQAMRRTLRNYPPEYPQGIAIDPCPFCVWYAKANGFAAC